MRNLVHSKLVEYSIGLQIKTKSYKFLFSSISVKFKAYIPSFPFNFVIQNRHFAATLDVLNLIMSERTLWTWAHLPTNVEDNVDKSWLHEGDAVENVHRLKISKHENIPAGDLRSTGHLAP